MFPVKYMTVSIKEKTTGLENRLVVTTRKQCMKLAVPVRAAPKRGRTNCGIQKKMKTRTSTGKAPQKNTQKYNYRNIEGSENKMVEHFDDNSFSPSRVDSN